jgi:pimeloyl-ACP methyl ester carboxylesterase
MAETLDAPPRAVIVIPGFGVSRLYDPVAHVYVWGTGHATFRTRYEDDLDLPESGHDRLVARGFTGSRGPINIAYQLTEGLRRYGRYIEGESVFPFAYDWRLSARENASKLGAFIDQVSPHARVDIVTHSAGAMVALTYVKLQGGADRVDHLVLIAPTRRGVIDAFRVLVRPERFIRRTFTPPMVETWPAIPELLPEDGRFLLGRDFDAWKPESWRDILPTTPAFERSIVEARRFRDELRDAPMPPNVRATVIAGDCVETARRVLMRPDRSLVFYPGELRPDERAMRKELFEPGDGTVPISSARGGNDAILFCDGHQGIASDPNVLHAVIELLRDMR